LKNAVWFGYYSYLCNRSVFNLQQILQHYMDGMTFDVTYNNYK